VSDAGLRLDPPVEFVPMRPEDLDAVVAAEARAHPFPWTRGHFADSLAAGHGSWLCRADDRLLGYAVLLPGVEEMEILNITVLPEYQRRGFGGRLLAHLLDVARGHRAARMLLEVRPGNAAALALYRRCGFAEIGRRRGYYPAEGGREDAIVMALPL
jgi:ribosomal-protein-alanine N-acetyltransferase